MKLLKTLKFTCMTFLILSLMGCAHTPSYKLDDVTSLGSPRHGMKIAVAPLIDQRPKFGKIRVSETGISSMIVQHFERVKLFTRQEIVGEEFKEPSPEQLSKLKAIGHDALLTGSITSYMGGKVDTAAAKTLTTTGAALCVIGPFTAGIGTLACFALLAAGAAQKGQQNGYAALELVRTSDGIAIWKGSANGSINREGSGSGAYKFADEALKNAITSLVEQIENADLNEEGGNKGASP